MKKAIQRKLQKRDELTAVVIVAPEVRCIYIMQRAAPAIVEANLVRPGANSSKITFSRIWKQGFHCSRSFVGEKIL